MEFIARFLVVTAIVSLFGVWRSVDCDPSTDTPLIKDRSKAHALTKPLYYYFIMRLISFAR
jgi:hypothetical protein